MKLLDCLISAGTLETLIASNVTNVLSHLGQTEKKQLDFWLWFFFSPVMQDASLV